MIFPENIDWRTVVNNIVIGMANAYFKSPDEDFSFYLLGIFFWFVIDFMVRLALTDVLSFDL